MIKIEKRIKIITNSITIIIAIIIAISMRNIINVLNWKDNENVKDKRKENIITVIIENDSIVTIEK